MNRFLKRHALDGLLLLPLFGYLFVLTGLPLLSCLVLSFTEGEAGPFPTLANYRLSSGCIIRRPRATIV